MNEKVWEYSILITLVLAVVKLGFVILPTTTDAIVTFSSYVVSVTLFVFLCALIADVMIETVRSVLIYIIERLF